MILIVLSIGIIFLIGYCIGVLGAGSKHKFWQKLICFFKHDTPTSFETLAARDSDGPSIRSSYFTYRKQRNRIKHFWQSAAALFTVKIVVILLISTGFQDNPLKAQNAIEVIDLDQAIAANQGLAAIGESPEQSPESYYFFEKQGEIKEEIITGAELKSAKDNDQEIAQLDEFKELNSLDQDLKINQESLNLVRIDEEKTTGDKIQELFFKKPFDFQEPNLVLAVSPEGEMLPVEMEGIEEDDQLIFSYEYGAYSESYETEEAIEVPADLEIEFEDSQELEFDLTSKIRDQKLIKTAQAQSKIAKAIRVKLKADTEAGYQVFQVNPDGSLYLYDGEELAVESRPVFEYVVEETQNSNLKSQNQNSNLKTKEEAGAIDENEQESAKEEGSVVPVEEIIPESVIEPIPALTTPEPTLIPEAEPILTPEPAPEPEPISFWSTKKSAQNADFGGNEGFRPHGSLLTYHPLLLSIAKEKRLSRCDSKNMVVFVGRNPNFF